MTTVQNISQQTGATIALVKKVSKDIIGHRHKVSTLELNTIIKNINGIEEQTQNIMYVYDGISQSDAEVMAYNEWKDDYNDSITKGKYNI